MIKLSDIVVKQERLALNREHCAHFFVESTPLIPTACRCIHCGISLSEYRHALNEAPRAQASAKENTCD